MKILLPLLFLSVLGYSQTTYKSLVSEYFYLNYEGQSKIEWLTRDIILAEDTIIIKSYGKEGTDIQKWRINNKEVHDDNHSLNTVLYTQLASGEPMEFPAVFTIFFGENNKVEIITCEIPSSNIYSLPDGAAPFVRFHID